MGKNIPIASTIFITIILTILLVATVNVAYGLAQKSPEYNAYCTPDRISNGTKLDQNVIQECSSEYDTAYNHYMQTKFYIFLAVGVLLILVGLFASFPSFMAFGTWTGLATGLILIGQSVYYNFENKLAVLIVLIVTIIIVALGAGKAFKKYV